MTETRSTPEELGIVGRTITSLWMMPALAFVAMSFGSVCAALFVLSFHWSDDVARRLAWMFIPLAGGWFCVGAYGIARWQIIREKQRDMQRE